jgi:hypothetical protein
MSISFDPTQRTTPSSPLPTQTARVSRSGLSEAPSSIDSRLGAQASTGGWCDWITNWIQSICDGIKHFFQQLFSPSAGSTTAAGAPAASVLDERILRANIILDRHFSRERILRGSGENSAMITIIKYNDRSVIVFGQTSRQRTQVEVAKARAFALLSSFNHSPHDEGRLKIHTMLLDGSNNERYFINSLHDFSSVDIYSDNENTSPLNLDDLINYFRTELSSNEERRLIVEFLRTFGRS